MVHAPRGATLSETNAGSGPCRWWDGSRWRLVRSWLQNINHKRSARYHNTRRFSGSASGLFRASNAPAGELRWAAKPGPAGMRETSCVRQMHKLPPVGGAALDYHTNSGFPQAKLGTECLARLPAHGFAPGRGLEFIVQTRCCHSVFTSTHWRRHVFWQAVAQRGQFF
jgi:hypothetical protein